MKKILIIISFVFIIFLSVVGYIWYSLPGCHMHEIFLTNIKSEQVFSTIGRDPTEICTFTLDENIDFETLKVREPDRNPGHTVKNFLDYFDEEIKEAQEGKTEFSLTTANIQTLQKIKQDISHMMTLSGTKYIYFLLKKGLSDHGVCLYNATENKGYCIMYHM